MKKKRMKIRINKKFVFYISFLIGILFFTFLSFSLVKGAIAIEKDWPGRFLWPAISLIALGALFSLAWLLLTYSKRSRYFLALMALFCSFWLFVFLDCQKLILWLIFLLSAACFYFAGHQAIKEKQACFKIHLSRILSLAILALYTGLILIIASFYYFHQAEMPLESFKVPPNITRFVVGRLDEFLGDDFQLGQEEKVAQEVFTAFIADKINQILGPYRKYIPLGLAFGLFVALRAIAFIYANIVLGIVWLLFKLMLFLKLIRVEKAMAEKEVIAI